MTHRALGMTVFLFVSTAFSVHAQQPQIPTLQVCNSTVIRGSGVVRIDSRAAAALTGTFQIRIDLKCDPNGTGYPVGGLLIGRISMTDSIGGDIKATTFEQVTSIGKATPTAYLNGRCEAPEVRGCRFWMTIADNRREQGRGTPDIVGFLVMNGKGQRVAYGTGPLVDGDIFVAPTSN